MSTFRSFTAARKFVHSLGLIKNNEWKEYAKSGKKPDDIPANPSQAYAGKGWMGIPDWLGNGNLSNKDRVYVTYEECKNFALEKKITKQKEWEDFCKSGNRPINIPSKPSREYTKQLKWKGWGDFLSTGRKANQDKKFLPFKKAKIIVQSLKLKNQKEFQKASIEKKLPKGITSAPWKIYEKEFTSWPDWLGTDRIANQTKSKNWLSWSEAKTLYRKIKIENNLKNLEDWENYVKTHKLPKGLSAYPRDVYTKERVEKMLK